MSDHSPQEELLQKMTQLFNRFRRTGDMAPIEDRREWEELVASKPPEERDLLTELGRFADLWRQGLGIKLKSSLSAESNELISDLFQVGDKFSCMPWFCANQVSRLRRRTGLCRSPGKVNCCSKSMLVRSAGPISTWWMASCPNQRFHWCPGTKS